MNVIVENPVAVSLGRGLDLKNPVMLASGTVSYGEELYKLNDLSAIGGIVTKAISLEPRQGNAPQRLVETHAGVLNAIGLANIGVERFIQNKMPFLRSLDARVVVNVVGGSIEDYCEVIKTLNEVEGIDGYEINLSCPNVKGECIIFGVDAHATHEITSALREITDRHLMIKLTPNVTSIGSIAMAAEKAGADSISLINTLVGMAVDYRTKKPLLRNVTGGLSGPAIKPVAVAKVWEASKSVNIPIIGMGGIADFEDAMEFFVVGASAVQIGTMNFVYPNISSKIARRIEEYFRNTSDVPFHEYVGSLICTF
ncbi:dihydroorotate dehydrogenase family protein [Chloroherpeton thalassium ATCC 35110]|uniref:Dihydroorotate dehydrogenase n=1 Tax=Chloroherpeton thalassium (strain ATCC 35110 / GB-78) TaxID=517418 RepID=B3QW90_CHLT3|nr:dihydroorotate dehydrogenase [Chloroherpeton thalassium]ACF13203.1 dihydroorotate dehydrogenase family protein [Chloroherpeton thalassium ATCC 35110]